MSLECFRQQTGSKTGSKNYLVKSRFHVGRGGIRLFVELAALGPKIILSFVPKEGSRSSPLARAGIRSSAAGSIMLIVVSKPGAKK